MNNRSQSALINILMCFALLVLTSAGITSYLQVQKSQSANAWVTHTYQVIGQSRLALINFLHAEILAHEYSVNGNPKDLLNMHTSIAAVDASVNKIANYTVDNPIQIANIKKLRVQLASTEQELNAVSQISAQESTLKKDQSIKQSNDIVTTMQAIINEELGLLENRNVTSKLDAEHASNIVLAATLLSILLLGVSFSLINYHLLQRNRAQRELLEMESKMKKIIDGSKDLIAAVDKNLNFIAFNKAYENTYENLFKKKLNIGMNARDALAEVSQNQEIINAWNRAVSGDEVVIISRWCDSKANENGHYYEIAFSPISNADKKIIGAMHIMRDITERMKVNQLKNEFVSIVSHELRTPLTSIRGALGLLVGGAVGDFDKKTQQILQIAHNNCERLIHLINDILDISKIETGSVDFQLAPIDLQKTLEEAVAANQPFAEKFQTTIKLIKTPQMVFVYADQGRLMQVITNLISNAVKFSPAGKEVEVRVSLDNQTVRVSILDHGLGISTDFQKQIFQKFAQEQTSLTRTQGGTGLGLSISKAIIEKLHGTIGFTTQAGTGSTFYFDLPIWLESGEKIDLQPALTELSATTPLPDEIEAPQQGLKILYVEDDLDLSQIVRKVLENEAQILTVQTTQSALDMLSKHKFDLVLLDLVLPDGYGANLIPELTKQNIPIIIFSAYDLPQKFVPFVLKSLVKSQTSNQELIQTIRNAIKRKSRNI